MPSSRAKSRSRLADATPMEREIPPRHLAGKWIAWSRDGMRIIAIGPTFEEARAKGREAGVPEPLVECVPPPTRQV